MNGSGTRSDRRATVVVIGTFDTKAEELGFVRDRLEMLGVGTLLVDVGIVGEPSLVPDVRRQEVAAATGLDLAAAAASEERGAAVAAMAEAAAATVRRLFAEGRCDGIVGAGGGGNTTIATAAMRALPLGVPKLMVSTLDGEEARACVGSSDLILVPSVADVAGLNVILRPILANAAAAVAGMAAAPPIVPVAGGRRIAATMFGVTTACVNAARAELEARGHEVVTFHARGNGGRAMEQLLREGFFAGVLDATTTELADEVVGGTLAAGPERLTVAGELGLPQVVSLGALDVVNFGRPETVPARFAGRRLSFHNPHATLLRPDAEESARIGAELARRLAGARGPTAVFVPLRGLSSLSVPGGLFGDPQADAALFEALRAGLGGRAELHELDCHINDPEFARAMAARLANYLGKDQT